MRLAPTRVLILVALVFVVIAILRGLFAAFPTAATASNARYGKEAFLLMEAITLIEEHAVFIPRSAAPSGLVTDMLSAYLSSKDPYSEYLTRGQYSLLEESLAGATVGIGMEIKKGPGGEILCFPRFGAPADQAGILPGDHLLSINGESVKSKSLLSIAAMVRGTKGARLTLEISTTQGQQKRVRIVPAELDSKNVSRKDIGPLKSIRLRHFTRGTTNEVRSLLTHWDAPALVIDIRGNSGGDLNVAIDTSMLFLKKEQPIVSVQRSRDTTHYRSLNERPPPTIPIYVWQDQTTASAAEVFVAALTDNKVATSIGTRTFGKGTQLELLELTDGSAIALTSGYLLTPAGTAFNNVGLKPNFALTDASPTTEQYLTTTLKLLGLPNATKFNDVRDQSTP